VIFHAPKYLDVHLPRVLFFENVGKLMVIDARETFPKILQFFALAVSAASRLQNCIGQ
jgi:hypothetical protein